MPNLASCLAPCWASIYRNTSPAIPWQKVRIFHGGQWRKVRYKEVAAVYWQGGAGQKPLRLFVVARIPYHPNYARRRTRYLLFECATPFGTPENSALKQ